MTLKRFLVHLLLMALVIFVVFAGALLWLKFYTNHGQEMELEDYVGVQFEEAQEEAEKRSFELIVKDSVHKVGQPGGIILTQNPGAGRKVKENRKIYVEVTKYQADKIKLEDLSEMFGGEYNSKVKELAYMNINSKVRGYRHDSGEPGYILDVYYDGRLIEGASGRKSGVDIEKGGTLEFILSEIGGGEVEVPELVCMQYKTMSFMLGPRKLNLGSIERVGAITDQNTAYVIAQVPEFAQGAMMRMGESIGVTIQQEKPESCDDGQ